MGFIYSKPLSIEGVFSKFDKDGNGVLSAEESAAAKNMAIFSSFNVKMDMTLETFEKENRDTYIQYEQLSTQLYNEQKAKIEHWLKNEQASTEEFQEEEIKRLEELEKMIEKEKEEIEQKLELQKMANKEDVPFRPRELDKMSLGQLKILLELRKTNKLIQGAMQRIINKQ